MKFLLVCSILILAITAEIQAKDEKIVAAELNVQDRSNNQNRLIVDGIVAAEENAQSRSNDQIQLVLAGVLAAEKNLQNRANQIKLQNIVHEPDN